MDIIRQAIQSQPVSPTSYALFLLIFVSFVAILLFKAFNR